mgnify:CR=1 FL=1
MKIMLDGEEIEVTKIKQSEFYDVLKDKVNVLLFGKSGWGKSQIVKRYCEDNELKLKSSNSCLCKLIRRYRRCDILK